MLSSSSIALCLKVSSRISGEQTKRERETLLEIRLLRAGWW